MPAEVIDHVLTFCRQDQTNRAMGLQICDHSGHPISDLDEDEYVGDEGPDDNDSNYDPLNDSHPDDDHHETDLDDDDQSTHIDDDDQSTHIEKQYDDVPGHVTDENTMANHGDADGSIAPVLQIHPDGSHMAEQGVGGHDTTENDSEGAEDNAPDNNDTIDTTDITTEMDQLYGDEQLHTTFTHVNRVTTATCMQYWKA